MAFTKKEIKEVTEDKEEKIVISKEVKEPYFYDMIIAAVSPNTQNKKGYLYSHPNRLTFMPGEKLIKIPATFKDVLDQNVVKILSPAKVNGINSRTGKVNDKTDYTYTILGKYDKNGNRMD